MIRLAAATIALAFALAGAAFGQKAAGFTVTTDDGFTLHGDVRVPKKAKDAKSPLVVFVHEIKGNRSSYADVAEKFFRAGYAAATFDLRGHNESDKKDGRRIDLDDKDHGFMRRDLSAVLKYFADYPGVDPSRTVLVGAGFGAILALKLGTNDDGVKAIIGLSTPLADAVTKDDASKYVERLGERALLLVTGKVDEDKKSAKDIAFYAQKAGSKAFAVKNLNVDARGADLLSAQGSLAGELVAWTKKALDPAKK